MNSSTPNPRDYGRSRKFEGFSVCYYRTAPRQWSEVFHHQLKVVVPLAEGSTQLALSPVAHQLALGQACIIPEHQYQFHRQYQPQRHQPRLAHSGELLMIVLDYQFIRQSVKSIFLGYRWCFNHFQIVEDPVIQFIAQDLKTKVIRTDAIAHLYCVASAQLLAIHLVYQYTELKSLSESRKTDLLSNKLIPILEHIHAHLDSELRVSELAVMADLSAPHFCRVFKKMTALSPHRYILLQRVERAKELLRESGLSLSDIALQCGFYDQSHFSLQFRNFTGMTPKSYRQKD